jgi:hypothetical protein
MVKMITSVPGLRCRICRVTSTPLRRALRSRHVGRGRYGLRDSLSAIGGFGNNLPVLSHIEERT